MSDNILPMPPDPRLQQAAQWRIRLTEAEVETCPAFEAWLDDPLNQAAWKRVCVPWDFFTDVALEPELLAQRQAALGEVFQRNEALRPTVFGLARAAALLLAVGLGLGLGAWWLKQPDQYQTVRGERRVITLEDGSRISLDADSLVTVRFRHNARLLELRRGQARFDVAPDKKRPFSVVAGDQKVVATGTAFNIDMAGPKVLVTLIEGRVLVYDQKGKAAEMAQSQPTPREIVLRVGEQLAAGPVAPPVVVPVNIQRVTAWTTGQVIFESETLGGVVERVNRYGANRIEIDDPLVAEMRISGVFNAGDVAGVVDIVTHYLPVHVIRLDDGRFLLRALPPAPPKPAP